MKIHFPCARTVLILIVTIVYTITLTTLFATVLSDYQNIRFSNFGKLYVRGYEVEDGDIKFVNGVPTLDWGTTNVGNSTRRHFTLHSLSNVPNEPILAYGNWNFTNSQGHDAPSPPVNSINVSWDLNNRTLNPGERVNVTVTLEIQIDITFIRHVADNNITGFGYDMFIYPSNQTITPSG